MLAPFVLKAKILIQEWARMKLGWDDVIPLMLSDLWETWKTDLQSLGEFEVTCALKPGDPSKVARCQLIHFADTSQKAYGSVSYFRCEYESGSISCSFLVAKCHLAPLKGQTIPRLEQQAAVTAIKQDEMLKSELDMDIDESVYFTDSQIVLHYVGLRIMKVCSQYHTHLHLLV
jgi:hypothetical protein